MDDQGPLLAISSTQTPRHFADDTAGCLHFGSTGLLPAPSLSSIQHPTLGTELQESQHGQMWASPNTQRSAEALQQEV